MKCKLFCDDILSMSSRRRKIPIKDPRENSLINGLKKLGLSNTYITNKVQQYKNSLAPDKNGLIEKILNKAKADRKLALIKKEKKTQLKKERGIIPTAKTGEKLTTLTTYIQTLRNANSGKNNTSKGAYAFLSNLYRGHGNGRMKANRFNTILKGGDKGISNYIKKQHTILTKNSSIVRAEKTTFDFKMDSELLHDLLFMIYLDMRHDGLFAGSFNNFLASEIVKKILKDTKDIPNINTQSKLIKTLVREGVFKITKNDEINPRSKLEEEFKNKLNVIWGGSPPIQIKKDKIKSGLLPLAKNLSKPIYISIDAEGSQKYISRLQDSSRYGKEYTQYYAKRLFTVPNLIDPGINFVFDNISSRIFRPNESGGPYTPYKFNYQKFKFNFGNYFTIVIGPNDRGTGFICTLNDSPIPVGTTKSNAQLNNPIRKIAKTFGDFLQILVNSALYKNGKSVVGATSDGNFVAMTGFVQRELFGITPRLIVDRTSKLGSFNSSIDGIFLFGLDDYIKRPNNATRSNSRATTKNNTRVNKNNNNNNNNASSNNQRGVKRVRNNTKNVSQPNAKRVNTTRNRLIQNLKKKKNLPNFVVNGLMRSYDNKRKTANQIIREANNFGRTFAMGKTAQIKSTLRPRKT
jgi:hypothetical protein